MNEIIRKIYETGKCVGRNGAVHALNSAIDRREGEFITSVIENAPDIRKTLEVGCAQGLSSLHVCLAIQGREGARHVIVDPFQNTRWDGVGVTNLAAAGVDFFELVEERSEFALPRLAAAEEGSFDFVFVDGWHTFDHTLIDCFYATRLLRVGGYLVIDDVSLPAVRRVVDFLLQYPCYGRYGDVGRDVSKSWKRRLAAGLLWPIRRERWAKILAPALYRKIFEEHAVEMIALKKIEEDNRNWDWHPVSF